nr:unnamed protein product [Callosobruchus chinensis]
MVVCLLDFAPALIKLNDDMCAEKGCDFLEFDIKLTDDGVPIVFHDATLERMADINMEVSKTTWENLKSIDISVKHPFRDRYGVTNIPTLEQAVDQMLACGQRMFIDIKDNDSKIVAVIHDLFKRKEELHSRAVVTSFFPNLIYLLLFLILTMKNIETSSNVENHETEASIDTTTHETEGTSVQTHRSRKRKVLFEEQVLGYLNSKQDKHTSNMDDEDDDKLIDAIGPKCYTTAATVPTVSTPEAISDTTAASITTFSTVPIRRGNPKIVCSLAWRPHAFAYESFKYPEGKGPRRASAWHKHILNELWDIVHTWSLPRITYYFLGLSALLLQKRCSVRAKSRIKGIES